LIKEGERFHRPIQGENGKDAPFHGKRQKLQSQASFVTKIVKKNGQGRPAKVCAIRQWASPVA